MCIVCVANIERFERTRESRFLPFRENLAMRNKIVYSFSEHRLIDIISAKNQTQRTLYHYYFLLLSKKQLKLKNLRYSCFLV